MLRFVLAPSAHSQLSLWSFHLSTTNVLGDFFHVPLLHEAEELENTL